jgi:GNAT superfamily N-acetyltransferase
VSISVTELSRDALEEARLLLARSCDFDRAADVAAEKLFGPSPAPHISVALAAREGDTLVGVAAMATRWLRLLAVLPEARGRGVGAALLAEATARARAAGATRLRSGDQPGNYLAPGVDVRNKDTIDWLVRRGFRQVAAYENLTVPLAGNPKVSPARAAELAAGCARAGYTVRRAGPTDVAPLLAMATTAFAAAWAFELERALTVGGVHIAVASDDGTIAAFAAHDGNNQGLGWFGPAGTLEAHRGKGLGAALLLPCLVDVAAAGHAEGVIAWIGPRPFYEKIAGARSERSFVVLEKSLP